MICIQLYSFSNMRLNQDIFLRAILIDVAKNAFMFKFFREKDYAMNMSNFLNYAIRVVYFNFIAWA